MRCVKKKMRCVQGRVLLLMRGAEVLLHGNDLKCDGATCAWNEKKLQTQGTSRKSVGMVPNRPNCKYIRKKKWRVATHVNCGFGYWSDCACSCKPETQVYKGKSMNGMRVRRRGAFLKYGKPEIMLARV